MPIFRYENKKFQEVDLLDFEFPSINPKTDILICLDNKNISFTIGKEYRIYRTSNGYSYVLSDENDQMSPSWATFLVIDSGRTFDEELEEWYDS